MNQINGKWTNHENSSPFTEEINCKMTQISVLDQKVKNLIRVYSSDIWTCESIEEIEKIKNSLQNELQNLSSLKEKAEELRISCKNDEFPDALFQNYIKICDDLNGNLKEFLSQFNFDSRYLYNIRNYDGQSILWYYDLEARQADQRVLDSPEKLFHGTCIIQLPNSELFCYGNENFSGFACIIDLRSFIVKRFLPYGPGCYLSGGVYYQNSVYIFGGCSRYEIFPFTWKFDFLKDRWIKMTPIPENPVHSSCVVYQESIIFCGNYHKEIYKYDLNLEGCSKLSSIKLLTNSEKILFVGNSRVYVFSSKEIFESGYENEYLWQKIGEFNHIINMMPFRKYYKGSVYISDLKVGCQCNYYQFNLETKAISMWKCIMKDNLQDNLDKSY